MNENLFDKVFNDHGELALYDKGVGYVLWPNPFAQLRGVMNLNLVFMSAGWEVSWSGKLLEKKREVKIYLSWEKGTDLNLPATRKNVLEMLIYLVIFYYSFLLFFLFWEMPGAPGNAYLLVIS